MNIEPNTTIYLLRNVPLDNTYTDTMWFENASSQWTHFKTRVDTDQGKVFTRNTYQRVEKGVMRLQVSADDIYNYNYMMFQNTNYGTKWFYAFINYVDYINNAVAEIHYEIDVMQTWAFDYQLGQCIVEREHSATDVPGDNIQPEPFDIGSYGVQSVYRDSSVTEGMGILWCASEYLTPSN